MTAFESQATTDQERAEVEMMRAEFEQQKTLANHPDPNVSSQAILGMQSLTGTLDDELDDFQAERIAATKVEADQFNTEIGRADGIRDDVQREGGNFLIRQDAYERALAVEDTAAGDQVLLVNSFKMVDPNSAVLPGEAATAANAAGVPDVLRTVYNNAVRNGERLSPDQRADLVRQMGIQYQVARSDQVDRNTSALERGRSQGIRDQLLPFMTIPVKTQDDLPFPTGQIDDETTRRALGGPAPDVAQNGDQANPGSTTGTQPENPGQTTGNIVGRGSRMIGTEGADFFSDVITGFRGGQKFVAEDGLTYARFPDGSIERARADTDTIPNVFEAEVANFKAKHGEHGDGFFSPAARKKRQEENAERMQRSPGLFQPGGFFDRSERPTNE